MGEWFNRFALDENDERVSIDETLPGHKYHCDACGFEMVPRKGLVRIHHFAHKPGSECVDSWVRYYDMSEWHREWQSKFPAKNQEVVFKKDGQTHRADVFINRTVIEFQHSKISYEHFKDRNEYYRSLGFELIWVFDLTDEYEKLHKIGNSLYKWDKPFANFRDFSIEDGVVVYFQIKQDAEKDERLKDCLRSKDHWDLFTDAADYYEEHKDDCVTLIKVESVDNGDISRFRTDGNDYYEGDFLSQYIPVANTVRRTTIADISEPIKYKYSKDHTSYYDGCPISKSGRCASTNIDIPEEKYDQIMPCYVCGHGNIHAETCRKRIDDLGLAPDTIVTYVKRGTDGKIEKLRVILDGEAKEYTFPPLATKQFGDTILDLSKKLNVAKAIFKNTKTGWEFKVTTNPCLQYKKYGMCFGYMRKNNDAFSAQSQEIYGADQPEWVCLWHKTPEELQLNAQVIVRPSETVVNDSTTVFSTTSEDKKTIPTLEIQKETIAEKPKRVLPSVTDVEMLCDYIDSGEITFDDLLSRAAKTPMRLPDIAERKYVINTKDRRAFYIGKFAFKELYKQTIELKKGVERRHKGAVERYLMDNEKNIEWVYFSLEDISN